MEGGVSWRCGEKPLVQCPERVLVQFVSSVAHYPSLFTWETRRTPKLHVWGPTPNPCHMCLKTGGAPKIGSLSFLCKTTPPPKPVFPKKGMKQKFELRPTAQDFLAFRRWHCDSLELILISLGLGARMRFSKTTVGKNGWSQALLWMVDSFDIRISETQGFWTRLPNVKTNKRQGFNHGFKVVRNGFRNHPQYGFSWLVTGQVDIPPKKIVIIRRVYRVHIPIGIPKAEKCSMSIWGMTLGP